MTGHHLTKIGNRRNDFRNELVLIRRLLNRIRQFSDKMVYKHFRKITKFANELF